MQIIEEEKLFHDQKLMETVKEAIVNGYVFVYPTDTVYGLGCNAEIRESVERIAGVKAKEGKPLSVIAPSLKWVFDNCIISEVNSKLVEQLLPGPYTLVLKTKLKLPNIAVKGSIGVRIPKSRFTDFVRKQGAPFITTSANLSGEEPIKNIKEVPKAIADAADIAIDSGSLEGESSRVFDMTGEKIEILRF